MPSSPPPSETKPVLAVAQAAVDDLRTRLRATRWAEPWPLEPWAAGTDQTTLRRLVAYWADGYDWPRQEAEINRLPHGFVEIAGVRVHYLRFAGEPGEPGGEAERPPLLLGNGWPSTFLELVPVARTLAAQGFTVVVPALPGFPFSAPRPDLRNTPPTYELWHRLMHDELGFERYGVHGGDLSSGHARWLAQAHPESVVGLHLSDVDNARHDDDTGLTEEELAFLAAEQGWQSQEGGYSLQQRTRPLTLAQGLSDSPSGLLAWILEKYQAWSDGDDDVSARFGDDFLLTQASLFWFTSTISTSFRDYYERANAFAPVLTRVEVPTAFTWWPADIGPRPPRSWLERRYHLVRYTTMPRGGHFAPIEEPDLFAEQIATFFG